MDKLKFLPYGRQHVTEADIAAVCEVLKSDWLTQGPAIVDFEHALADRLGVQETVACSSGTAALHLSMLALGIGPGDAVITTPNTFAASANCARFVGTDVYFADIDPENGLIEPDSIARILKKDTAKKIKAIIPVHFAGQPADLPAINDLAKKHGAWVVDDACHAIGATYNYEGQTYRIGNNPHSDMTVFSFHPVKHVAMGEGGAITTNLPETADRLRLFRSHGISRESKINEDMALNSEGMPNPWYYEMVELGFNYRLTDIQATLGIQQLKRLEWSLEKRRELAGIYCRLIQEEFTNGEVRPLINKTEVENAYHLFVIQIDFEKLGVSRAAVMNQLRAKGIGTQVHYIPVHLQPYYQRNCGTKPGDCPNAEAYYEKALSLPMYPNLADDDIKRVVDELVAVLMKSHEKKYTV
ncbi:MAG: UDP-4-amino-4,6-dideoxy-N-acetyl-beta-L-altrosamine transaminase [candidate division Zixibacteria bacterium]